MVLGSLCNTCNKSVSFRNSIECSLCLTQTHLKCNNLNVVDGQLKKIQINFGFAFNAPKVSLTVICKDKFSVIVMT